MLNSLAISLAHPSGKEGGKFLVHDFYLPSLRVDGGGGVGTLWFKLVVNLLMFYFQLLLGSTMPALTMTPKPSSWVSG
jgi:hypothetical protein